ncbi:hypothetical protein [Armatimonas sp.]|uniref:hypothetical protein n=1 Tax=Armatimonas sp. TaxID=1872638 RepID=UPI00286BFB8D|nr:hypothetical protein [Armatimonas sp.]
MTKLEQDALTCLHYGHYCPLPKMAEWVASELEAMFEWNPERIVETADTYRAALEGILVKGWLTVVRETPEVRRERWTKAGWLVPLAEDLPESGDLDFTSQGFWLYQKTCKLSDWLTWVDEEEKNITA